jgi:hypothetical protein
MDDTYHTYLNRVVKLTLPASYETQVKNVQTSPKFAVGDDGSRRAVPFPGFSIVTPPGDEDAANRSFYARLMECQQQLNKLLEEDLIVTVAPNSLHFTLADLIWDNAYLSNKERDAQFDRKLVEAIGESFNMCECRTEDSSPSPVWQVYGLTIRPRAIEMCLVPKDEDSYQRIANFRRAIYQNARLISLGIEQQYYFTAHITLAYFGNVDRDFDRSNLIDTLQDLNLQWIDEPQELTVANAQLRRFTDMIHYHREPDWPSISI